MSGTPFLILTAIALFVVSLTVLLTPPALRRSLFAAFCVGLVPLPALADAATGTTVNLSGLAGTAITVVGGALVWLARAGINALVGYFQQRTKLELDDHVREYLYKALEQGAAIAQARLSEIADRALSEVDLRNAALAHAVNYVIDRVPDALDHFDVTPDALTSMIEARVRAYPPLRNVAVLSTSGLPAGG